MSSWNFTIEVLEGPPGYADDDFYKSEDFSSMSECYLAYRNFNAASYWRYYRSTKSEYFSFCTSNNFSCTSATLAELLSGDPPKYFGIDRAELLSIIS